MADRSRRRGAAQAADAGRSRTDAPRHSQSGSVISPAAVAPRMIARPAACPPNAEVTSRDCEVVQMPLQHLFHPDAGFRRRAQDEQKESAFRGKADSLCSFFEFCRSCDPELPFAFTPKWSRAVRAIGP